MINETPKRCQKCGENPVTTKIKLGWFGLFWTCAGCHEAWLEARKPLPLNKPTVEQVAWVITHLVDAMRETGTFRYLIYDRMGYGEGGYGPLYTAGGMALTNAFIDMKEMRKALKDAHKDLCNMRCPTQWKTEEGRKHSGPCVELARLIADAE